MPDRIYGDNEVVKNSYMTMKKLLLRSLILTLNWNKSRTKLFSEIIIALIENCSVNTKRLAQGISGQAKLSSKIQRVYRLFRDQLFDFDCIANFVLSFFPEDKYIIALDRTCWKFGKNNINILFLAVVIGKISVPVYWHFLDYRGTCDSALMQDTLNRFITQFGKNRVKYLLADREFMSKEWLKYLIQNNISFVIPLRKDMKVRIKTNLQTLAICKSFNHLNSNEYKEVDAVLWGHNVRLGAYRNSKGELMVIVSNNDIKVEIFALYRYRWAIERLFKHLKSGGFNIEKSHLIHMDRFAKLIAVCAIASALIIKNGLIRSAIDPIKIKKCKDVKKQLYSLFTYGLDHLKSALKQAAYKVNKYIKSIFKPLHNIKLECQP